MQCAPGELTPILIMENIACYLRKKRQKFETSRKWLNLVEKARIWSSLIELGLVSLEKVSPPEDADPRKAHFYS